MRHVIIVLALASAFSGPAAGEEARALYASGQFQAAARAARADPAADAQALAARAINAQIMLYGARLAPASLLAQAQEAAEAAVKLAPRHVEARLQLATALGLRARRAGPAVAFARGWPGEVKRLLDAVIADAPREAWAYALLGGWHLEAVRKGGTAAGRMLGAQTAAGRAAFERAMALDPDQPAIPFYYAACLLDADAASAGEARVLLARAVAGRPTDAFEREIAARARAMQAALQAGDVAGAQAQARRFL